MKMSLIIAFNCDLFTVIKINEKAWILCIIYNNWGFLGEL